MTVAQTRRAYVERLAGYLGGRYGVEPAAIFSRDKHYVLALARHMIAYKLLSLHWTVTEIGELLGRDHSTVSHAKLRMSKVLRADSVVRADYEAMPEWGAQVFTAPDLLELYARLTYHLAKAQSYGEQIEQRLAAERVPSRTDGVLRALVNAS